MGVNYQIYIRSNKWREFSKMSKRVSGGRCQACWREGKTETHHKHYGNLGKENLSDVIELCPSCHKAVHLSIAKRQGRWARFAWLCIKFLWW